MTQQYKKDIDYEGIVVWFGAKDSKKKTYGFISCEGFEDIFCHFSDINVEGYKTLLAGQKVSFKVGVNHDGDPKAINVTPMK